MEQLQHILSDRGIGYHHFNNEETLINKILGSNPGADGSEESEEEETVETEATETETETEAEETQEEEEVEEPVKATISEGIKNEANERVGIVSVELINPKRTGSVRVRDYKDSGGNKRKLVDKNGDPWVYMITKNIKLNKAIDDDYRLYLHLKDHPVYVKGNMPSLKLIDEGSESVDFVNTEELAIDAKMIIKRLGESELRDFARVLNVTVAHMKTPIVVKTKCYELANKDPQFVIDMWNDPRRDLRALLYKAMDKGLIEKIDNVLKIKGQNLAVGTSFDQMVLWFEENDNHILGIRHKLAS